MPPFPCSLKKPHVSQWQHREEAELKTPLPCKPNPSAPLAVCPSPYSSPLPSSSCSKPQPLHVCQPHIIPITWAPEKGPLHSPPTTAHVGLSVWHWWALANNMGLFFFSSCRVRGWFCSQVCRWEKKEAFSFECRVISLRAASEKSNLSFFSFFGVGGELEAQQQHFPSSCSQTPWGWQCSQHRDGLQGWNPTASTEVLLGVSCSQGHLSCGPQGAGQAPLLCAMLRSVEHRDALGSRNH